jgi:hypothetical protein
LVGASSASGWLAVRRDPVLSPLGVEMGARHSSAASDVAAAARVKCPWVPIRPRLFFISSATFVFKDLHPLLLRVSYNSTILRFISLFDFAREIELGQIWWATVG